MKATEKSLGIENLLDSIIGAPEGSGVRISSVKENRCLPRPMGCGGLALKFKDEVSRREYRISGWCQDCQDRIFKEPEE